MSDKTPNYQVEMYRIEVEIDGLRLNIKRNRLRILEMKDEIQRLEKNEAASEVTIKEYESKLASLRKDHGNG